MTSTRMFSMVLPIAVLMLPMFCFLVFRRKISRWMDARKVRPSFVNGCMQLTNGVCLCVSVFLLTDQLLTTLWPFLIIHGFWIANGLDKMLGPPEHEYKPHWYVGGGDPSWKDPSEARFSFRFSLRWILCVTLVFCIFVARFSFLWKKARVANQRHAQAIQSAVDLGATVNGAGDISFGGLETVTDKDLAFLSDTKEIRVLDLSKTAITNEALKQVAKTPRLYSLDLSDTAIDDGGLKLLEECTDLDSLDLANTKATGRVLPAGADGRLTMLDMEGCPVDRESLKNIANATQGGSYLRLADPSIDDSMIDILKTTDVMQLHLSETGLTKAARDELKASLSPKQRSLFIGSIRKQDQMRQPTTPATQPKTQ